jgi:catechol 2,3-dioxygenase-like lactoylglutathione lyase family enzyme
MRRVLEFLRRAGRPGEREVGALRRIRATGILRGVERPALKLTATVLDSPDPRALAEFYRKLFGWPADKEDPEWVTLRPPGGGPGLSFQYEELYERPAWPAERDGQQMQLHLDIEVEDLDGAVAYAVDAGATLAEFQPQEHVRVLLDPDGHPFCFFVNE